MTEIFSDPLSRPRVLLGLSPNEPATALRAVGVLARETGERSAMEQREPFPAQDTVGTREPP